MPVVGISMGIAWLYSHSLQAQDLPKLGRSSSSSYTLGAPQAFGKEVGVYLDRPVAYILEAGQMEAMLQYQTVNSSMDFFGVREKHKEDSATEFLDFSGNTGDLSGVKLLYNFGLTKKLSLLTSFQQASLELGSSELNLEDWNVGGRWEWMKESEGLQVSLELQGGQARASGLRDEFTQIQLDDISEIANFQSTRSDIEIESATVRFNSPQFFEFGGIRSQSGQARLLLSKRVAAHWFVHGFFGYQSTNNSSELRSSIPQFKEVQKLLERDQQESQIGLTFDWKAHSQWLLSLGLEGNQLTTHLKAKDAPEDQKIVRVLALYQWNHNWAVQAEARYFQHFFAGEYPLLLNERTTAIFEKAYGYAALGVIYTFDYNQTGGRAFFVSPNP